MEKFYSKDKKYLRCWKIYLWYIFKYIKIRIMNWKKWKYFYIKMNINWEDIVEKKFKLLLNLNVGECLS